MLFSRSSTSFINSLDSLGTKSATPKSKPQLRRLLAPSTKMSCLNQRDFWKNGASSRSLTEYQGRSLTLLQFLYLNDEIQIDQKKSLNPLPLQFSSLLLALEVTCPNG